MRHSIKRTLAAIGLSTGLVVGLAVVFKFAVGKYEVFSEDRATSRLYHTQPSPKLSPTDVVRLQLSGLGQADPPDPGAPLKLAYAFLAPAHREAIGEFDPLSDLLAHPLYRDLVAFQTAEFAEARVAGDHARHTVQLLTLDGRRTVYSFLLTRQREGEFTGSWMTTTLLPIRLQSGSTNLTPTDAEATVTPAP